MARDRGLEELLNEDLRSTFGVTDKPMFGGWAWLFGGNLFCGARDDGLLVRLGKGRDGWALQMDGIIPMVSRGKHMHGWVRADERVHGDDAVRRKLISCALEFVASLPKK